MSFCLRRAACIEIPPGFLATRLISSTQVPIQVPLVFTFLLYALNFNMSEYMSDEHVLPLAGGMSSNNNVWDAECG